MRLYSKNFGLIGADIVRSLRKAELVEIEDENTEEAELDVVGVLREYSRTEREISQKARELASSDPANTEHRIKRNLAREKNFRMGEEGLEYIVNQIIETFMHSTHIEEVFGADRDLRAIITPIMKRHTQDRSGELDAEVRGHIKNLQEGSAAWEIEYEKAMARVKRNKGLED